MPKIAKELSDVVVKRLTHPTGQGGPVAFAVGGCVGLYLQVTAGGGRSWVLRLTVGVKRRELGLGPYPEVKLAEAREAASKVREKVRQGIDPVEERKAARAALEASQREGLTFAEAVEGYMRDKADQYPDPKNRQLIHRQMLIHAVPTLGKLRVGDIDVHAVHRTLDPIWRTKTVTAQRVRERIENILDWATVRGHRQGENPARWKGNLKELLPAPSKVSKTLHRPAVQLKDAARWMSDLRGRDGIGSRALEFLVLTAARSGEVRGATWDEIEQDLWIIPAERMKMDREHRVPLSGPALALLNDLPREGKLIFPAARGGQLSDMTLSATMRRMKGYTDRGRAAVPHGWRSTFRDWAAEGGWPRELAESALAHKLGSDVEVAYLRSDMVERRRAMMQAWSDFLDGIESDRKVVPLRG